MELKYINEHIISLNKLILKDFRGFGYGELSFNETLTLLIADNGGGKTSILIAISEFLNFLLSQGIKGEKEYTSLLKSKDVKNGGSQASLCELVLDLTYEYPNKAIFKLMNSISDYLNDYQLIGDTATLIHLEDNFDWSLAIDNEEDTITLPSNIIEELNLLVKEDLLDGGDVFNVAYSKNNFWTPNLQLIATDLIKKQPYTGQLKVYFELNKSSGKAEFHTSYKNNYSNYTSFISALEKQSAFLEDFHTSAKSYELNSLTDTLPLLVYYGSQAINTDFHHVGIMYNSYKYKPYDKALGSKRLDFEDFFSWFNSLKEEPPHILDRVVLAMESVMNADRPVYSNLRVEKGLITIDKKIGNNTALPITINQFSAGERNLFALVGDLVKRAIELNPLLFEVDISEEDHFLGLKKTLSDPLFFTRGIVLIDEIDLHLHPRWQRVIVPKLKEIFPKIQFIITTHSLFVLQNIRPFSKEDETKRVLALKKLKNYHIIDISNFYHYGSEISSIASSIQDVEGRNYNKEIDSLISNMYEKIDSNDILGAKRLINKLAKFISYSDSDIIKAQTLIEFYQDND